MADNDIAALKADATITAKKAEKVAEKVTAQVTESVKTTAEAASANLKDMQETVKNGLHKAAEMARGYVGVQRTAVETVVKAGKIYGEGLQTLATHAVDVNRSQFEDTMAHFRALTSVKSVKEAMDLQAKFARATASRVLTETSTFVEDYLKVAGQALTPVTERVREAAEKVKSA